MELSSAIIGAGTSIWDAQRVQSLQRIHAKIFAAAIDAMGALSAEVTLYSEDVHSNTIPIMVLILGAVHVESCGSQLIRSFNDVCCCACAWQAQELHTPITSVDALLKSGHRLYICCD
jgi:hypothetical protein